MSYVLAASFAAEKHKNQRRKNKEQTPYINHPLEVAAILVKEGGVTDETILQAAVLHDTIEDTNTSVQELIDLFGNKVAEIVMEVTDDKKLSKLERKLYQINHSPFLSNEAKQVKLADKISNLRSLLHETPVGWSLNQVAGYFVWASKVAVGLQGVNKNLDSVFNSMMLNDHFPYKGMIHKCLHPKNPVIDEKIWQDYIELMKQSD